MGSFLCLQGDFGFDPLGLGQDPERWDEHGTCDITQVMHAGSSLILCSLICPRACHMPRFLLDLPPEPSTLKPGRLKWFVEAEKTNARWAMIAVAGIMGQELLGVDAKW